MAKKKINFKPESLAKATAVLEAFRAVPGNEEKRIAAVKAANIGRVQSEEEKRKRGDAIKAAWVRRKRFWQPMQVSEEVTKARIDRLAEQRARPGFEEKRIAALKKVSEKPELKIKRRLVCYRNQEKYLGVKIPASLRPKYKKLRKTMKAPEALAALGPKRQTQKESSHADHSQ